jgi:pantothenate kinase
MGEGWAAYLPMDGFHLSNSQLRRLGREQRKGAPDTFDVSGYVALLARVSKETESVIYAPDYDREAHEPIAARLAVLPHTQLVVTEGNYLALDEPGWREARTLIGQLWYVAADDALREERLIARQIAGGRTEDAARAWAEGTDRANGDLVKRTEKNCDRTVTPALR